MSELLQLLTLAKDADLSGRVNNLIAVAQSHDAEIDQLREKVNEMILAGQHGDMTNVIFAWVGWAIFVATIIFFGWYVNKLERRIAALEAQKS